MGHNGYKESSPVKRMPFFPPLEELLEDFTLQKQQQFGVAVVAPVDPRYMSMVGIGVGFRTLNVDEDVQEYLAAEMGEEINADVPLAGDVTFPYLNLVVQVPVGSKSAYFRNHAFVELEGQWMSSILIEDQTGSEKVPVTYKDAEIGDATTDWRFYFGDYYSFGTRFVYVPTEMRVGGFGIKPKVTGAIGFSSLHNKVDLSMDISEARLIQDIGVETVEEELGIYTTSKTYLELHGVGTYVAPGVGLMVSRGRFTAAINFGYRAETIPITIKERTVYGDGEESTNSEYKAEMNTSGMEGSATISYSF